MWGVRECEDCPIWRREPGSQLRSLWNRNRDDSQVALELILTTRVRVIASVVDSQSWGDGLSKGPQRGLRREWCLESQVVLVIGLSF